MRDIFRAKDKNGYWRYGAYYNYDKISVCFDEMSDKEKEANNRNVIICTSTADWGMKNNLQIVDIDKNTLGIYVCKDKNNKRAYTGDMIKTYYENGDEFIEELVYKGNQFLAKMMFEDIEMFSPLPKTTCVDPEKVKMTSFEVIGNKYDNPELIGD